MCDRIGLEPVGRCSDVWRLVPGARTGLSKGAGLPAGVAGMAEQAYAVGA